MSAPAHVLIIPASFTPAPLYAPLQEELKKLSIASSILALPSVLLKDAPTPAKLPNLTDDTRATSEALAPILAAGQQITIVAHSYGGLPATQVLSNQNMSSSSRRAAGLAGGIERIIYVSTPIPELGRSVSDPVAHPNDLTKGPALDFIQAGEDGVLFSNDIEAFAAANLNGMPRDQAIELCKGVGRHSGASFAEALTYPGWKDVDVCYVSAKADAVLPLGRQQLIIGYLVLNGARNVRGVLLDGGHCSILVDAAGFAGVIRALLV